MCLCLLSDVGVDGALACHLLHFPSLGLLAVGLYIHCVHHHDNNIACQQGERCSRLWRLICHLLAVRKFMLVADSKF